MLWFEALTDHDLIGESYTSLARAHMRCVQMFDKFGFQNVLSNGDGDCKNDTNHSFDQLFRIYVEVI